MFTYSGKGEAEVELAREPQQGARAERQQTAKVANLAKVANAGRIEQGTYML